MKQNMVSFILLIFSSVLICREVSAECVDLYTQCEDVKEYCYFSGAWQDYMSKNCQKTCTKHCTSTQTDQATITSPTTTRATEAPTTRRATEPPTTTRATEPPTTVPDSTVRQCGSSVIRQVGTVSGIDAEHGAWPWIVSISYYGTTSHFCGGSLIAPKWVLTSSQCVAGKRTSDIEVIAGEHNRHKYENNEQYMPVRNIIKHPSYVKGAYKHDIALLELERPVYLHSYAKLVCLPPAGHTPLNGLKCILPGWGTMSGSSPAPKLQQAILKTINRNLCFGQSGHICARRGKGILENVCRGDMGGPLVCQDKSGNWVQQGIAGFRMRYCRHEAAFTKVGDYIDWISSYTNA